MGAAEPADIVARLPGELPIFPLPGVLLLPGGQLPLNMFEPRYLAMTRDAMAGQRFIGMVQPTDPETREFEPTVYGVGCAGRISECSETEDGRFLITLTGVCRFRILAEIESDALYRLARADFGDFRHDLTEPRDAGVARERLLPALRAYLKIKEIPADWQAIEQAPDLALVNALAMICPFEPSEKQALLEARDVAERGNVMTALIEMALLAHAGGGENPVQ